MKQVMEVRNQLRQICVSKGLKLESCGRETTDLRYAETYLHLSVSFVNNLSHIAAANACI